MAKLPVGAIGANEARIVPHPGGQPPNCSIIVVHDGQRVRAYWNVCAHLPIPLDSGTGELARDDEGRLVCSTHGAVYEPGSGVCADGPCIGSALEAIPIEIIDGEIFVVV